MNFTPILPEISLFFGAVFLLIFDVFFAKKIRNFSYLSHLIALIICAFSASLAVNNLSCEGLFFNEMIHSNSFIAFAKLLAIISLIFAVMLSIRFVVLAQKFATEFMSLMMIATCGGLIMISANNFLPFYLGLELQALSSYLLASFSSRMQIIPSKISEDKDQILAPCDGFLYNCSSWQVGKENNLQRVLKKSSSLSANSSEAGMKYFILGSLASGLMLFGISLIYGYSGSVNFSEIAKNLTKISDSEVPAALVFGFVLVLVAMFFKVSAAPFHMWTPDVYQGSPTPTAAFFATTGKITAIAALMTIVQSIKLEGISNLISVIALLSIAVGSFGAIFQKNLKRLLAYSSVSHVGFMLLAVSILKEKAIAACIIYLLIYAIISIGTFGFLTIINSNSGKDSDAEDEKIFNINSLAGLSKTNPSMAFAFSVLMFSTAGIPPLAGFFSKFYVLANAIGGGLLNFAIIAIIFSAISSFYYLRIVKIIYFDKPSFALEFQDYGNVRIIIMASAVFSLFFIFFMRDLVLAIHNFIAP